MQQAKNKKTKFVFSIIFTSFLTIICFLILGTFYKAIEHSIALNIIVWSSCVFTAYYLYFGFAYVFSKAFKNSKPKLFDGWAILSGLLTITLICLFNSFSIDDYLFVESMGLISGIFSVFQIIYSIIKKKQNINN